MQADDLEMLRQFAHENSQEAFARLVDRHLNLVYSAALRQVNSPQLAEEITQSVFLDLSRNAAKLKKDTLLSAWLFQVTRRTAIDLIRQESRRRVREQTAAELAEMNSPSTEWTHIAPLLDEAMEHLDDQDREALLLRFFENKSLREVGARFGASENAAQKRVSKAIDQLRQFFSRRGVTVGSVGLIALLSANATKAAPTALSSAIASTLATKAISNVGVAAKAFVMTTTQKILIGTTMVLLGVGVYEATQVVSVQKQIQQLREEQKPLTEQLAQLRQERDQAVTMITTLQKENEQLRRNSGEIPRLRGEVTQLRQNTNKLARAASDDPFVQKALVWKANKERLQQLFNERPEQRIPEMKFLSEDDWLNLAKDEDLESEKGIRKALSQVRSQARNMFVNSLSDALSKYINVNGGRLPDDILQLKSYFADPVEDAMLLQYKMQYSGKVSDIPRGKWAIASTEVDEDYDTGWGIGPSGFGRLPKKQEEGINQAIEDLTTAFKAFAAANNGQSPKELADLKPFLTTKNEKAAWEKLTESGLFKFTGHD